jgi:hypothetical protein
VQQGYAVIFLTRKEALRPFSVAFGQTNVLEVAASFLEFNNGNDLQVRFHLGGSLNRDAA